MFYADGGKLNEPSECSGMKQHETYLTAAAQAKNMSANVR